MAIACIVYLDGSMQYLRDEDKPAALEAYTGLKRRAPEVTETVRSVLLPPSWQPQGYRDPNSPDPFSGAVNDTYYKQTQGKDRSYS